MGMTLRKPTRVNVPSFNVTQLFIEQLRARLNEVNITLVAIQHTNDSSRMDVGFDCNENDLEFAQTIVSREVFNLISAHEAIERKIDKAFANAWEEVATDVLADALPSQRLFEQFENRRDWLMRQVKFFFKEKTFRAVFAETFEDWGIEYELAVFE
ncbi:MAG: hypothetical protein AAGJ87_08825, partial [Pseudomonadota bacterium]